MSLELEGIAGNTLIYLAGGIRWYGELDLTDPDAKSFLMERVARLGERRRT